MATKKGLIAWTLDSTKQAPTFDQCQRLAAAIEPDLPDTWDTSDVLAAARRLRDSGRYEDAFTAPGTEAAAPKQRQADEAGKVVHSKADLKTAADKAHFIGRHGASAYLDLPAA
jgi:hypothetical protein